LAAAVLELRSAQPTVWRWAAGRAEVAL